MSNQKELLSEFSIPTYQEWRQAAEDTLKGVPFEKKLITKTYEGIDLQPIYNEADRDKVKYLAESLPGSFPYNRGICSTGYKTTSWKISQAYSYPIPKMLNDALKKDLESGQDAIAISVCNCRSMFPSFYEGDSEWKDYVCAGVQINDIKDLEDLFDGIDITKYLITFLPSCTPVPCNVELAALFFAYCDKHKIDKSKLNVNFGFDLTNAIVRSGELPTPVDVLFDDMTALVKECNTTNGNISAISIDACTYHNSGATATQGLAYSISTAVMYIKELLKRGINIDEIAKNIHFNISVGIKFFIELSKIRAARVIWAKIIKEFGGNEESQKMQIHTFTSKVYTTKFDPFVNILRGTTEGLAAVLAGVNSLHIGTFDEELGMPSDFSRRVARNIQNILKDEAHIIDTIDPAGGSYYIETLTDKIITEVWNIFREIEKIGGISDALFSSKIQDDITDVVNKRKENVAFRRDTILGTNKYPNLLEAPVDSVIKVKSEEVIKHLDEVKARKKDVNTQPIWTAKWEDRIAKMIEAYNNDATIADIFATKPKTDAIKCKPLPTYRTAELFEELRFAANNYKTKTGKAPQMYFECFGTLKQYKPRADFSNDFFAVGGFEITMGQGYLTDKDAIANIEKINAPIVVICSTDDIYPEVVPNYVAELKKQKPNIKVILAGLPKDYIDAFKEAGVDDFIHIKSNVYETLKGLLKSINVI
ncbi:MAG: acyl-CoA mutase large subunit family protein [Bacteroidetes bacterium]|nr:acyl-CoA mutase large subunit family protein [Bacteroidota bacterium]